MGKPTVLRPSQLNPAPKTAKNPYESYRDAAIDSKLVSEKLKSLLTSENRHGDLQVMLSATGRIAANLRAMLQVEEA
jgi:hypothetical protein